MTRITRITRITRVRYLAALLVIAIGAGVSAPPADAALAERAKASGATALLNSCWASPATPVHSGNNVSASITWQCNGWPSQMQIGISLTSSFNGTRYTGYATCSGNVCTANVGGAWVSGGWSDTWTLRADWAYVTENGTSRYEFGPSWAYQLN